MGNELATSQLSFAIKRLATAAPQRMYSIEYIDQTGFCSVDDQGNATPLGSAVSIGGAPPRIASASAAGIASTISASDHTHAFDFPVYAPQLAGMQASGVLQQVYAAPNATPSILNVATGRIPFGANALTGLLTTNVNFRAGTDALTGLVGLRLGDTLNASALLSMDATTGTSGTVLRIGTTGNVNSGASPQIWLTNNGGFTTPSGVIFQSSSTAARPNTLFITSTTIGGASPPGGDIAFYGASNGGATQDYLTLKGDGGVFLYNSTAAVSVAGTAGFRVSAGSLQYSENGGAWTPIAAGTGGITTLTGDVTAGPGTGSQVATLATVNANVGNFTNATITVNAKGLITAASTGVTPTVLTFSNGVTLAGSNVTNDLITGKAGGQTAVGGTAASENLTFSSTSNGTKGKFIFGSTTGMQYSEVGAWLSLGIATPATGTIFHAKKDQNAGTSLYVSNPNAGASANANFSVGTNDDQAHNSIGLYMLGTGFATSGLLTANTGFIQQANGAGAAGNMIFSLAQATKDMIWTTTTSYTERMRLTNAGVLSIAGLTSNGFVKTSGGTGTLSVDTTSYQPALALTNTDVLYATGASTVGQSALFQFTAATATLSLKDSGGGTGILVAETQVTTDTLKARTGIGVNILDSAGNTVISVNSSSLSVTGQTTITGNTIVTGTLGATGLSSLSGGLTVTGGATAISGGSATINGSVFASSANGGVHTDANGNLRIGKDATLATNATDGFPQMPSVAGRFTGAPTLPFTDGAPFGYDKNNNNLTVWNALGGAWQVIPAFATTAAAGAQVAALTNLPAGVVSTVTKYETFKDASGTTCYRPFWQ